MVRARWASHGKRARAGNHAARAKSAALLPSLLALLDAAEAEVQAHAAAAVWALAAQHRTSPAVSERTGRCSARSSCATIP